MKTFLMQIFFFNFMQLCIHVNISWKRRCIKTPVRHQKWFHYIVRFVDFREKSYIHFSLKISARIGRQKEQEEWTNKFILWYALMLICAIKKWWKKGATTFCQLKLVNCLLYTKKNANRIQILHQQQFETNNDILYCTTTNNLLVLHIIM